MPNLADGTFSLLLVTNTGGQVFERNTANNSVTSQTTVQVEHPDLVVDSVTVLDSTSTPVTTAQSGDSLTIDWQGHNAGTGPTTATWTDKAPLLSNERRPSGIPRRCSASI